MGVVPGRDGVALQGYQVFTSEPMFFVGVPSSYRCTGLPYRCTEKKHTPKSVQMYELISNCANLSCTNFIGSSNIKVPKAGPTSFPVSLPFSYVSPFLVFIRSLFPSIFVPFSRLYSAAIQLPPPRLPVFPSSRLSVSIALQNYCLAGAFVGKDAKKLRIPPSPSGSACSGQGGQGFVDAGKREPCCELVHAAANLPVAEVPDTALVGMAERA